MKIEDRAAQMWSLLALAARNRQVLTYSIVSKLTGMHAAGLGATLEPIQSYCLIHRLPPLTALVVNESTGFPGGGFVASAPADVTKAFLSVFAHDWLEERAPKPEELAAAAKERPSNGVAPG